MSSENNTPKVKEVKPLTEQEIKGLAKKAQKAIAAYNESGENEEEVEEGGGKIKEILRLFIAGVPRAFIVRLGFNRTTVYRQCGEYTKLLKAPAMEFHGYELFEKRVQKTMKAKKLSREEAVDLLMEKDIED